jgi:hypothetical protein
MGLSGIKNKKMFEHNHLVKQNLDEFSTKAIELLRHLTESDRLLLLK